LLFWGAVTFWGVPLAFGVITVIIFCYYVVFSPFGFVPVAFGVSPSVIFGGLLYPTSFQIYVFYH